MITIKLCGGLGNQLFQYAFGYQLAKKLNTEINLDISWFDRQNLRSPDILKFDVKYNTIERVWNDNHLLKLVNNTTFNRALRVAGIEQFKLGGYRYLKETRYRYRGSIAKYEKDNTYLDGYWQCPSYFDWVRPDLVEMFDTHELSVGIREFGEKLKNENSIAIHVRRGDYPQKKLFYSRLLAISDEYYEKAVAYMLERVGSDANVYVFSNDKADAIMMLDPLLHGSIKEMPSGLSSLDEWYLMKCCKNQIIGNSTFSWWAAYLNENKGKAVCAPGKYMGNDDILPKEWHKIEIL